MKKEQQKRRKHLVHNLKRIYDRMDAKPVQKKKYASICDYDR